MKDHGLLFSDAMVRAILEDRKDQTRRVVTPQPWVNGEIHSGPAWFWRHGKPGSEIETDYIHTDQVSLRRWIERLAPIKAGDIIHVREAAKLCAVGPGPRDVSVTYRASQEFGSPHSTPFLTTYPEDEPNPYSLLRWTPGIHMPRWATRLKLQVLLVQAEQLQALTEAQAAREGILPIERERGLVRFGYVPGGHAWFSPIEAYRALWDELNAERGYRWLKNPWVYSITFKRLK